MRQEIASSFNNRVHLRGIGTKDMSMSFGRKKLDSGSTAPSLDGAKASDITFDSS